MTETLAVTYWHWFILGALLMAVEVFIPGAFFLWPGIAAIIVGALSLAMPGMTWALAVTVWAILSVVAVTGWVFYRKKHPAKTRPNTLNQRGSELVGQEYTLSAPIVNGKGEIHAGDTMWRVVADSDLPAGTKIRVMGLDGTSLRVEQVP